MNDLVTKGTTIADIHRKFPKYDYWEIYWEVNDYSFLGKKRMITNRINKCNIGPLGLKGKTTALASFLRVGPQRASGVRIVCLRLCCCVEPRVASVLL